MIKRIILLAIVVLTGFTQTSYADTAAALAAGTAFANGIVPTSPSQMVNPSAVNATAWNSGSTPTAAPSNMGAFSSPSTDNSTYNSASSLGLSGIGLQTQSNCANYVQGTNALMDQQCGAVNFMSNNCLSLTPAEKSVLGSVPIVSAGSSNCRGTYGQGASQFNYGNQITSSDPMFSTINTSQSTAATTLAGTCTPQTVVTAPAQYATNNCIVSLTTSPMGCSQTLNCTTVIPSPIPATPVTSCSSGYTLTNGTCTAPATAANPVYSCSSGTLSGTQCYYPAYQPAGIAATGTLTPTGTAKFTNCGQHSSMTASMCATFGYPTGYVTQLTTNRCKIGSVTYNNADFLYCQPAVMVYSCPTGYTLSGTTCYPPLVTPPPTAATLTGYSCPSGSVLSGTSCIPTTSTITTYTCGAGMTLVGTSCQADPIATCTWSDTCGLYSTSAGSALPTP